METKIIKTINWSESKEFIKPLVCESFDFAYSDLAENFSKFLEVSSENCFERLTAFLAMIAQKEEISDISSEAFALENTCLFLADDESAFEIILRRLHLLNTGGKCASLWCYLDDEKKAVVHFINRGKWYAEAYFLSSVEFRALHLWSDGNEIMFLPVVFQKDLSDVLKQAEKSNGFILKDYKLRDKYALLSNKSGKRKRMPDEQTRKAYPKDKHDFL